MNIQVLDHTTEQIGLLVHNATVRVDNFQGESNEIVTEVSTKLGYHPLGHGIYHIYFVEQLDKNTYSLKWETGTHCD